MRNVISTITLATALASCGGGDFGGASGDFGATQGGVQDMSLARDLIAAGKVPPPEAFIVEGMFSEHELGLEGAPCDTLLCLRSAIGFAPDGSGDDAGWFQIGLSSTVDPEAFVRPSLTLIATVDVSGSMGWSYSDNDTPAAVAVELLSQMAAELGPGDRIAIVTYGSDVRTALELTPGGDPAVQRAIDDLGEGGVTNMEAGMRRAYDLARAAAGGTDETRVVLFTDARPNVGATSASDFEQIAASGAGDGIGLSVMGLGLGLGAEVFKSMSQLRGGNAFSLMTVDDVAPHMDDNWPWMVSPIAYDLRLNVETPLAITAAHGFPGTDNDETISTSLDVATVFLSKRKGALLVQLDGAAAVEGFTVDAGLSYTDLDGVERGEGMSSTFDPAALDERGQYFEQAAVAKTTALALLVSGMAEAATLYASNHASAVERMTAVAERFSADAEILGDAALDPEVQLAADLLQLMIDNAPQGDFYPL